MSTTPQSDGHGSEQPRASEVALERLVRRDSPKWCTRPPCVDPGRCDWVGSCYRSVSMEREYAAAKKRPCRTCEHYKAKWCDSIEEHVEPWWTGCVRHTPNTKPTGR